MELFVFAHQNYNYEKYCDEIESIRRENDEFVDAQSELDNNTCKAPLKG